MTARIGRGTTLAVLARSLLIQGSWNYHTMLGTGFAFTLLPALRSLFASDPAAFQAALDRHVEHFNAHPYFASFALGATLRLEADGAEPDQIRRFKTAVRGPLGSLGDGLIWSAWLPAVSLGALTLVWLGVPAWVAAAGFLVVYNAGHLLVRVGGFAAGWRAGRDLAPTLAGAHIARHTDQVRRGATLLLGVLAGVVMAVPHGFGGPGPWALAGTAAFVVGHVGGQRVWRPAAVLVVVSVGLAAAWGLLR